MYIIYIYRDEFIEDYYLVSAMNILKYCLVVHFNACKHPPHTTNPAIPPHMTTISSTSTSTSISSALTMDSALTSLCLSACSYYLRIKQRGEYPGVDRQFILHGKS